MRRSQFLPRFGEHEDWRHSHLALAYDAWAPAAEDGEDAGKVPPERGQREPFKSKWLDHLERLTINRDYQHAYDRWKNSLESSGCHCKEIKLASRLLVGHGNSSVTEVGLSVHHTWGVPVIPGSALKGLCAHYTAAAYGRQDASGDKREERARFSGPGWDKNRRRVETPPGDYYRALFGAPDVPDAASTAGLVVFHDALYVPRSCATGADDAPFAVDVLTVHQRSYYGQDKDAGGDPGQRWPNDYESPNPVGFISVRPGAQFLLAIGGDADWAGVALNLLEEALREWGAGGKTSAGYGHFR
ncbi:MAG TPA: type III-B CRISPR module RAMP protein Cmr6 [Xanthobacteraceae bacterium]|nr:type III-B CRISPR module RAMP protein Cmr6 [Xanthobacteraceae bacterium]